MSEASRIRDFAQKVTRDVSSLVTRKVGLQVLSGVVLRTPVLTGRARGNWLVNLRAATGRTDGPLDKGGGVAIAAGAAVIAQQKGYDAIVLENNLPYIGKLNDGSSKQAPAGYVEDTLSSLGMGIERE